MVVFGGLGAERRSFCYVLGQARQFVGAVEDAFGYEMDDAFGAPVSELESRLGPRINPQLPAAMSPTP